MLDTIMTFHESRKNGKPTGLGGRYGGGGERGGQSIVLRQI